MCIHIQNSSDNNQTQCILIHTADIKQTFSVLSQKQAKGCRRINQEEDCCFGQNTQPSSLAQEKFVHNYFSRIVSD